MPLLHVYRSDLLKELMLNYEDLSSISPNFDNGKNDRMPEVMYKIIMNADILYSYRLTNNKISRKE